MRIALCSTGNPAIAQDLAGGLGVGWASGQRSRAARWMGGLRRTRCRPVPLVVAYLAAVFARLGHQVVHTTDPDAVDADLYVFCPSLATIHLHRQAMTRLQADRGSRRVLVVGPVASILPEAFDTPGVTVVKGEPEQLLWTLDQVLQRSTTVVQLGAIEDLDRLPSPDWSPFPVSRFRVRRELTRFPTALVEMSRGCTQGCHYCPHTIFDYGVRFRDPELVVEEIRQGVERWGFRSFRFCDPLFGLDPQRVFRLASLLGRLPRPVQFSLDTRADVVTPEMLRVLRQVGLTGVRLGIETPREKTLLRHGRTPVDGDRQREFLSVCRDLGVRTVAGFMIGFPEDTVGGIGRVLRYAQALNPTFAEFYLVTPYPGTEYHRRIKDQITDSDLARYTRLAPVTRHPKLPDEELLQLQTSCTRQFYLRWKYLRENASLLWPILRRVGIGGSRAQHDADPAHKGPPRPMSGLELIRRKGLRQDTPHRRPSKTDDAHRGDEG